MDWLKIGQEFGLVGVLIVSVSAAFFFILKWVLEQFKIELVGNREERKEYLITLNRMCSQIDEHNARSREFTQAVAAEHREMIAALGRINGYKHD